MKLTKIHLFLILLLSLIFCCCLGRPSYYEGMSSARTVTGPQGNSASVYTGSGGNTVVRTSKGSSNDTSSYSANTYTGPEGNSANTYTGPQGNTAVTTSNDTSSYSANTYTGPQGNSAIVANGPQGQAVVATSDNTVNGISSSQIPSGQEDLYILKSQVVPPVCPVCPSAASCPRQEACQPCPPCARCPEPSFECKKVPNYASSNDQYLPRPVLSDFSTFGS